MAWAIGNGGRGAWGALLAGLLAVPLTGVAGKGPLYRYGEAWWFEYEAGERTQLLLHFGPPQFTASAQLRQDVAKSKQEDELLAPERVTLDRAREDGLTSMTLAEARLPPVDERHAPAGTVFDYSNNRLQFRLGPGVSLVPAGRFGGGLASDGSGAIDLRVPELQAVECWFRAEALPAQEACLLSLGDDEARLLLRPDGRLELRLKKPTGTPNPESPPEVVKAILAKRVEIVTEEPIAAGEWVHVMVYDQPHPMPGGGEPWDARIKVNGSDAAGYMSERHNNYPWMGGRRARLVVGNSAAGGQGFRGLIDEVRVSSVVPEIYERPPLPWRDAKAEREPQFNRPWFRSDSTVVHASLDRGLKLDVDTAAAGDLQLNLRGARLDGVLVEGIRGKGWLMDPQIGFARVPLKGLNLKEGALEFWVRPQNWDDCTGYWQHSPPLNKDLSVARVYAAGQEGGGRPVFSVTLPRANNLERSRVPVDPGHWLHVALVWDAGGWAVYVDGKVQQGRRRDAGAALSGALAYAEFGVSDTVTVARGEVPRLEIDEVVGYSAHLRGDEVAQARKRWMARLEPIPLFDVQYAYKWSLRKLEFTLIPLLPPTVTPATASVALYAAGQTGAPLLGPFESKEQVRGAYRFLLSEDKVLPFGTNEFRFAIRDAGGKAVAEGTRNWRFEEEPWRHCQAGVLDKVPPPWTPIRAEGSRLETRMTHYVLGGDGLPAQIEAAGTNLLAAPLQILDGGKPMAGRITAAVTPRATEAEWASSFAGASCDVDLACRMEFDGMLRFALNVRPKGRVQRLTFVVPLKAAHASRWLAYPVGARGVSTGTVSPGDGLAVSSRTDPVPYKTWREYVDARKVQTQLTWEAYWPPRRDKVESYGFYTHADLNDMNRGLWWFCDNAAGWAQSKTQGAVEIVRRGEVVALELNLVAEPCDYRPDRPIVFAILPHPARPLPEKYRLFNQGVKNDPRVGDVFDAFMPWPADPRAHSMQLYPAPDPKRRDAGPSWEYAERCIPLMKAAKPLGLRTMYLSKAWFSCRAGGYDNWEWRSGDSSAVALTPGFVNYLCWEMDNWIGRDIFDAIYLDECYEHPASNLEAGLSVRLPDGTEQPGVTNFEFRELMKRWRGIFHQHGRAPFQIAHLTYSWQYQGVVFCDAYLDGENRPIVSLNSRDWIDSTSKTQFEVVQNARLWGVASFYMPFVAEGGFDDKSRSQYPRWQWRMARQAQSQFAHYETATVYEGQGNQVYRRYWSDLFGWGAGDDRVTFHPYWDCAPYLTVADQGGVTLVSLYRQPGKALVIASNRAKEERTLNVVLNLKALGLKERPLVRVLDSTFNPPPGDDFTGSAGVRREAEEAFETQGIEGLAEPKPVAEVDLESLLEGKDGMEAKRQSALEPRLEGATLGVPVRARDYRVVVLE